MDELEEIRKRKIEKMMAEKTETAGGAWPSAPVEVTDSSFDAFVKGYRVAVVDCWAPWCGPCRMISPIIEAISSELKGKVAFGKLNTDDNQMTAMQNNIAAIPTLLIYRDGKLVDRIVGAVPKDMIMRRLQKFF